jgi:imidazolonepropionase-like amidohydrolase
MMVCCDCHIHMVLDGRDWRQSIARHAAAPQEALIRQVLENYRRDGYTYLRDGGDRWGVGKTARALAEEYGIRYRTPLSPLCRAGHYGGFIGEKYDNFREYTVLMDKMRKNGADFIKIMISGLMDFDRFDVLTEDGLPAGEIRELIHIAHEEGFSVMAHANGARTVEAAAAAGVDSVEHGAYLDRDALQTMAETGTVWVPTLSTIANLRGKGRFNEEAVCAIFDSAAENLRLFAAMGGLVACGSDAGAWAVPHGCNTEHALLRGVLGDDADAILANGNRRIMDKF